MTNREEITASATKTVSKFSGTLVLLTNIGHDSSTLGIYEIPWAEIRKNDDLRAMLYARTSSKHALKIDKIACNYLINECANYLRSDFFINRDTLEKRCKETGKNAGVIFEEIYIELINGSHGTIKQDVNQKIDVIGEDGKRYQLKASIAFADNHGSYSTSNGRAID